MTELEDRLELLENEENLGKMLDAHGFWVLTLLTVIIPAVMIGFGLVV